jgi:hypothetical protein
LSELRALAAAAVVALAALAPAVRADEVRRDSRDSRDSREIELPGTRAVLDVPSGWTPVDGAAGRGLVAGYRGGRGIVLAVTRAQVPNTAAYYTDARDAYVDLIERGIAARVPGYRRVARRFGDQHGTPALDLEASRDGGATIVVRVLLFWTYALSLAIEVPPGADAQVARAIAAGFAPKPKPPSTPSKP